MSDRQKCPSCGFVRFATDSLEGACPVCLLHQALEVPTSEPTVREGTAIGHYTVRRFLGRGGMAEVYAAWDETLKREVALKMMSSEASRGSEGRARLKREAHAIASLNHPNICTVYEIVDTEQHLCIVMELVDGTTLAAADVPSMRLKEVTSGILEGLQVAHEHGMIHRDLKPSNIMLTRDGRVKLMDFGLAKGFQPEWSKSAEAGTAITRAGHIIGSPSYMSPEQINGGELDHRSDIFSVGVVLYELFTGRRPFSGTTVAETFSSILRDEPFPMTKTSASGMSSVEMTIRKALEKQPANRYQSALEMRREVLAALDATRPGRVWTRWGVPIAATVLATVLGFLFLDTAPNGRRNQSSPVTRVTPSSSVLVEQAKRLSLRFSKPDNDQAIRLLQEELRHNPGSAEAYSQLGLAKLKQFWWYRASDRSGRDALQAAENALQYQPDLILARVVKAVAYTVDGPAPDSYVELARCLQESPRQLEATAWLAYNFFAKAGHFETASTLLEGIDHIEGQPYSAMVRAFLDIQTGNFSQAMTQLKQLQLDFPDSDSVAYLQGRAAIRSKNMAMLENAIRLHELLAQGHSARFFEAYLSAVQGETALSSLDPGATALLEADYELTQLHAQTLARKGALDEAVRWLTHSVEQGSYNLVLFGHDDFDVLRTDRRFESLRQSLEERTAVLASRLEAELGFN